MVDTYGKEIGRGYRHPRQTDAEFYEVTSHIQFSPGKCVQRTFSAWHWGARAGSFGKVDRLYSIDHRHSPHHHNGNGQSTSNCHAASVTFLLKGHEAAFCWEREDARASEKQGAPRLVDSVEIVNLLQGLASSEDIIAIFWDTLLASLLRNLGA